MREEPRGCCHPGRVATANAYLAKGALCAADIDWNAASAIVYMRPHHPPSPQTSASSHGASKESAVQRAGDGARSGLAPSAALPDRARPSQFVLPELADELVGVPVPPAALRSMQRAICDMRGARRRGRPAMAASFHTDFAPFRRCIPF